MATHSPQDLRPVIRFFDECAPRWDAIVGAEHAVRLRNILRDFPIRPDARILDVGCGSGVLFPILAERLNDAGCIVSLDISGAMLAETRRRIAGTPHRAAAFTVRGDIVKAPLADASFDCVLCNSCFPHFEDQQAALAAMARLLRPGGALIVCHSESREAINALHRKVGGVVGGHELPDDAVLQDLVRGAGLILDILKDSSDAFVLAAHRRR